MISITQHQVVSALQPYHSDIRQFTCDLIAIASENPPGNHYDACVQRICQELDKLGLSYDSFAYQDAGIEPRQNILSFVGNGQAGQPTVYFHGHYDVVPAQDPAQFIPRVEDGWLVGRGSTDMKAGLASMIYAAFVLRKLDALQAGRVGLCIVADEETGGQGGSRYLDELGVLGQDGVAMFTMEPTSGVIWNANRGAITLKITVNGKAAHVGLQHQGVNAFEHMLTVANELQALKAEVEHRRTAYTIEPTEAAHSILMLGGVVSGGTNFNVVPDTCSFTLERRFNPEEDLATEKAGLWAVLEACQQQGIELEVEMLQEGYASGVDEQHPVAQTLAETITTVTGAAPRFEMCPGLLEIRWYANQGIPAFAYGPGLLECAHGPDERVEIERIYEHAVIYALAAAQILSSDM
ncbi:MAG: ArgE/DapE family deacylase [Chloroflexota bacterium]